MIRLPNERTGRDLGLRRRRTSMHEHKRATIHLSDRWAGSARPRLRHRQFCNQRQKPILALDPRDEIFFENKTPALPLPLTVLTKSPAVLMPVMTSIYSRSRGRMFLCSEAIRLRV